MGCMRDAPEVFLVLEAVVMEIINVKIIRDFDEKSEMILLKI